MGLAAMLGFGKEEPKEEKSLPEEPEAGEKEDSEEEEGRFQQMTFPIPEEVLARQASPKGFRVLEGSEERLRRASDRRTAEELGDRSTYVGASDIGGCLRKAFLSKRMPMPHSEEELIRFKRGHLAEEIVADMLPAPFVRQHELISYFNGIQLRCHIDFLLTRPEGVYVVETKSVQGTISAPYDSWELQVHYQMGMYRKAHPGVELYGRVVAIDVNTGWRREFEIPWREETYREAVRRTEAMVEAMATGVEPEAEAQFYCGSCAYKEGCPAYAPRTEMEGEIAEAAIRLAKARKALKEAEAEKARLYRWMLDANVDAARAGDVIVRLQRPTVYQSVDVKALLEDHPVVREVYASDTKREGYVYFA